MDRRVAFLMHMGQEIAQVLNIGVDAKAPFLNRNISGIAPVCDPDIVFNDQGAHGIAQQRGMVTGHRGHQENARLALE